MMVALVKVVNDLRANTDAKQLSVLVLLDLSAAFSRWVGLFGLVLNWFRTYTIYTKVCGHPHSNEWKSAISATPFADMCITLSTQPCYLHR
jgi:hypothetical protein